MDVAVSTDPEAFLAQATPLLLAAEPRHNLILGLTETMRANPGIYPERRFWLVTEKNEVVAAAMRTPPHYLVLARPRDERALESLVAGIEEQLPGVVGACPETDEFARLWAGAHEVEPQVIRNQGVYALERVQPVPDTPGASRVATPDDRPLLLDWMVAFGREVLHEDDPGRAEALDIIEHRLGVADGGFLFWEDAGETVSVSGWGGPTPNGIRIGPVYTPPQLRGRGYATALVAELSQTLLDGGRRFCFLFTDLANPTSNAIYERIGYVRVCEAAMVSFSL